MIINYVISDFLIFKFSSCPYVFFADIPIDFSGAVCYISELREAP